MTSADRPSILRFLGLVLVGGVSIVLGWGAATKLDSLGWIALLIAYVVSVGYAIQLWSEGDHDGTSAIILVALLPPIAIVLLALHWLGRRLPA